MSSYQKATTILAAAGYAPPFDSFQNFGVSQDHKDLLLLCHITHFLTTASESVSPQQVWRKKGYIISRRQSFINLVHESSKSLEEFLRVELEIPFTYGEVRNRFTSVTEMARRFAETTDMSILNPLVNGNLKSITMPYFLVCLGDISFPTMHVWHTLSKELLLHFFSGTVDQVNSNLLAYGEAYSMGDFSAWHAIIPTLQQQPAGEFGQVSTGINKSCFNDAYINGNYSLDRAVRALAWCATNAAGSSPIYSKSCAIVQASCSGKSRLMHQVGRIVPMIYLCQRSDNEDAYPVKTPFIVPTLCKNPSADLNRIYGESSSLAANVDYSKIMDVILYIRSVSFFVTCSIICGHVSFGDKEMMEKFLSLQFKESFWTLFIEEMTKVFRRLMENINSILFEVPDVNSSLFTRKLEMRMEIVLHQLGYLQNFDDNSDDQLANLSWLVCLDEARHLNVDIPDCNWTPLVHLNRAARLLPKGSVFVFMDTLSDINLLDSASAFQSDRMGAAGGAHQFVFTDILCDDIHAPPPDYEESITAWDTVKYEIMCQYGKPIWLPLLKKTQVNSHVKALARMKIYFDPRIGSRPMSLTQACALIGVLTDLDFTPSWKLASELIGSHGAVVEKYDIKTHEISLRYLSDPVLAHASLSILNNNRSYWSNALSYVSNVLDSNMINVGFKGEFVSQILCLMAKKKACMTVLEFLREFVGPLFDIGDRSLWTTREDFEESSFADILDGLMNLSHFAKIKYTPKIKDLANFYRRGVAVVCKDMQHGVDLIIPVVLRRGDRRARPVVATSPDIAIPKGRQDNNAILLPDYSKIDVQLKGPFIYQFHKSRELVKMIEDETEEDAIGSKDIIMIDKAFYSKESSPTTEEANSSQGEAAIKDPSSQEYTVCEDNMTFILIQCKNFTKPFNSALTTFVAQEAIHDIDERKVEGRFLRPHLGLGMFFDKEERYVNVEKIDIKLDNASRNGAYVALRNLQYVQDCFEELNKVIVTSGHELSQCHSSEQASMKAIQNVITYGTDLTGCKEELLKQKLPFIN